ncbi:MAG: tetratricopeptide repeat protein [Planctomycetota bacterium]
MKLNVLFLLAALTLTSDGFCDTVMLSRGAQVDGKITSVSDSGEVAPILAKTESGGVEMVVVKVDDDLSVAIPKSRVRRSITDAELGSYAARASSLGQDANAHFELGKECKGKGMEDHAEYHYRRAIGIDPNHVAARKALGYVRDGGDWILFSDQQRRRGLIYSGSWRIPEEYAIEKSRDEADEKSKRWIKEFGRLKNIYLKAFKRGDPQRTAEAFDAIAAIDDPFAAVAFASALEKSRGTNREPRKLRELYVKKLADFRSVAALVKTGLEEPDAHLRDLSLEKLQQHGASSAVATYLGILRTPNASRLKIKQALRGLQFFPDPELWREYVDALVTEHKVKVGGGPGISTGFGSNGSSGLGFGSKEEIRTEYEQHAEAVDLLRQIAPEANHRYDKAAWRQYFANQLMRSPGDLRRDP